MRTQKKDPQQEAMQHASRSLGIPLRCVYELATLPWQELEARDKHSSWRSLEEDMKAPAPRTAYALGSARILDFGTSDPNDREVMFLKEFNAHNLETSEWAQQIKSHESFGRYCEWLASGHEAPYISAYEDDRPDHAPVSSDRRRVLSAQEMNRPVTGWLSPNNPATRLPLKLGDVLREVAAAQARLDHGLAPNPPAARQHTESDLTEEQQALRTAPMPSHLRVVGKLRATSNSKGHPIAQTGMAIRNFWKWFGDSPSTVDEQGRPLVLYHGSICHADNDGNVKLGDIHSFDRRASITNARRAPGLDAIGSWFSDTPGTDGAGMYAQGRGVIYPVYIRSNLAYELSDYDQLMEMWEESHSKESSHPEAWARHKINKHLGDPDEFNRQVLTIDRTDLLIINRHENSRSKEFARQRAFITMDENNIASTTGSTWDREDRLNYYKQICRGTPNEQNTWKWEALKYNQINQPTQEPEEDAEDLPLPRPR